MKKGWVVKKISDLFEVKSSKRVHQSDWKASGIPFYRAREVVKLAKYGYVNNDLFISPKLYEKFTKEKGAPKDGDIIISAVGTLGQCYLVKETDKFYFKDASVLWFEKISRVDSSYIEYSFLSDIVLDQVMDKSMGATVGTLTINRAKNIQIPIPPLPEQQQIVAILDEAFAAIDQAKANIEKNIRNARELFQSKLNEVFSRGGDGWVEKVITDVVAPNCSLSYGIVQPGDEFSDGLPLVRPTDLRTKYIRLNGLKLIDPKLAESYQRTTLSGNELLLCVRGDTGVISIATNELKGANVTRGIVPIAFNDEILNNQFAYYQLISIPIQKNIKEKTYGTALMQINIKDLRKILMVVPPIPVQEKIVKNLDTFSENVNKIVSSFQQKLNCLAELKKSLLQKAFAGELTVFNHDLLDSRIS